MLRLYLILGCSVTKIVWLLANPIAALMGEPALAGYVRLLAIDLPLFCAAQAHRNIIVGLGQFRRRAIVSGTRWIARLVLIVMCAELSGSALGAIWGSICASLVELVICRFYVRPGLFLRNAYPWRQLCGYAWPLVAAALCLSLYSRVDLILLKALGATADDAGVYGVAQNLALLPSLLSFALAPALLHTLNQSLQHQREMEARDLARQAIRGVLLLLPVAGIVAGGAPEIIALVFGPEFLAASAPLRLLIFASVAFLLIAVATSVMTAWGKPRWVLHTAWPLLLCATLGHLFFIRLAGATGAAAVTTAVACIGAVVTVKLVRRVWHITVSTNCFLSSLIVSAAGYAFTASFHVPEYPLLVLPKLACAVLFVPVAFWLLGEFSAHEISAVRATFKRQDQSIVEATG